jgi:hypothetical protein
VIGDIVMKKNLFSGLKIGIGLLAMVLVAFSPDILSGIALAQQMSDQDSKTNYTKIGFALMKENMGFLSVGLPDSVVLKKLGDPEKKSAARIWGADGMEHQSWYYQSQGIELDMIQKDNQQIVDRISIKSPCDYKTQRGIQIGSKEIEVQTAYKTEINPYDSKPDSAIVAGTIYGGIIFGLKNGIVNSIFIGAAAE